MQNWHCMLKNIKNRKLKDLSGDFC